MKSLNLSDFIVAIILGMVICNTVGVHAVFRDGLRFSTTLTKTGIVVMGCKYSFAGLIKTGSEAIIISLFLFTSAIILMWLSRRLSMSPSLGACLAAGLSICGVSACVAIAPAVRAKNEDIAYTIAVVLMFGLLALFIFPFIGHWLRHERRELRQHRRWHEPRRTRRRCGRNQPMMCRIALCSPENIRLIFCPFVIHTDECAGFHRTCQPFQK